MTFADYSTPQLISFLAALRTHPDELSALATAVEEAAAAVDAEIGAVVRDGAVVTTIGYPRMQRPDQRLIDLVSPDRSGGAVQLEVDGIGPCHVARIQLEPSMTLIVARAGSPFTPAEAAVLRGIGRVLMLTLAPLRLLSAERRLRERSDEQSREQRRLVASLRERQVLLEHLNRIQGKISHRARLEEVFDAIVDGVADVVGQELVVLRLLDTDETIFPKLISTVGVSAELRDSLAEIPVTAGVGGQAVIEERLICAGDYAASPYAASQLIAQGVRAAMATPIYLDGKVAGSLIVAGRQPQTYSEGQQDALLAFAQHASVAMNDASATHTLRQSHRTAVHRATHDPLTDLANRTLVAQQLTTALQHTAVPGPKMTVLLLDIDRFKTINDSFGHSIGDEVLLRIAGRLMDAVPNDATLGRVAADEFVIVLEGLDMTAALQAARRMAQTVAAPISLYGRQTVLTASIGLVQADVSQTAEEILHDADIAMYHAKRQGRDRTAVFHAEMRTGILERLETEHALRLALPNGELAIHYQPMFDVATQRAKGVEALLRWHRPGRGLVPPDQFIPIAEEAGLMIPIGAWVLEQACRQLAQWHTTPWGADLHMNVNLSARQFIDPGLVNTVTRALAQSGLDGGCVWLEITENILMDDSALTGRTLDRLRALGVRLSIDDFGTGYSSLAYLKRFAVDELKIDRSFVAGLASDTEDQAIVRAVVSMGHALGLTLVAEGAETHEQLAQLRVLGCDTVQGFLLGRPDEPTAIAASLAKIDRDLRVQRRPTV